MKAIITADLLFGDAGKGSFVDLVTAHSNKNTLVIRYNGGAQCAHNVHTQGKHFCFHQLSSGSFNNCDTYLLDTVIVNTELLRQEIADFRTTFKEHSINVYVHQNALVTTPYHIAANRAEEMINKHGSCGLGIWKTVEFAETMPGCEIRISDLLGPVERLKVKLALIRAYYRDTVLSDLSDEHACKYLDDDMLNSIAHRLVNDVKSDTFMVVHDEKFLVNQYELLVFEGAQGVMLDKDRGFVPHVSATDTTMTLAENFLQRISFIGDVTRVGIIRSYVTRHGAGPLPTEVAVDALTGEDNKWNFWQGDFRVGTFDKNLLQQALQINPVDGLFITCLDNDPFKQADGDYETRANELANIMELPLFGFSYGKDRDQKQLFLR